MCTLAQASSRRLSQPLDDISWILLGWPIEIRPNTAVQAEGRDRGD